MAGTPTKAELRALPKKQRRVVAREVARELKATEERRRRRSTLIRRVVAAVAAVGVLVVAVLGAQAWVAGRNRGPVNMISDGVLIGGDGTQTYASSTPALAQGDQPEPSIDNRAFGVLDAVLYVDYTDPEAATLWATAAESLTGPVTGGQATLELHPIAPDGSASAVAAAAALGCVAELAPDRVLAAHTALLGGTDWASASLVEALAGVGIDDPGVAGCVRSGRFSGWAEEATARAGSSVPFDVGTVTATTLVLAGEAYQGDADDATAFTSALSQAWGAVATASQALAGTTD
ncbi:MAG TPA: hypothetical protein PKB06_09520 [Actinotalea sp.]|nr:hypothetical protein [Actinotalea sp.]